MYRRGDGVPQSHLVSYMWCDIAVGFGHEAAIYVRQTIAEHLTEDSILMESSVKGCACLENHRQNDYFNLLQLRRIHLGLPP